MDILPNILKTNIFCLDLMIQLTKGVALGCLLGLIKSLLHSCVEGRPYYTCSYDTGVL